MCKGGVSEKAAARFVRRVRHHRGGITHRHPFYKKQGFKAQHFPEAEKYYAEAISIPIYFGLSDEQQEEVINIISKVLNK